jgi:hypothetical protein
MFPVITSEAANEALRSAHKRGDIATMRKLCTGVPDAVLRDIGDERADLAWELNTGWIVQYR